jgi:hypothetical protein
VERARRSVLGLALLFLTSPAAAHPWGHGAPGSLVSVEVLVEGRWAPLYAAPDASGRWYLEAREGAHYSLRLRNRTAERLAIALSVDGLNVISGERSASGTPVAQPSDPGRMYVLEPWSTADVRGWRTSLQDIQRFVFVDERASYAARAGKANARMGWIELSVYRERYPRWPYVLRAPAPSPRPDALPDASRDRGAEAREGSASKRPPASPAPSGDAAARSYPGTGWGPRADDPVVEVQFDPQPQPAERVTLRYEYRRALQALGIDFGHHASERLWERERGVEGFARPPER